MSLCEQCGKKEATVHITRIANATTAASHFCEACAREKGFVVELPENLTAVTPSDGDTGIRQCSQCHLKFSEFQATGLLGCPACYGEFQEEIDKVLAQQNGPIVHTGKHYAAKIRESSGQADVTRLIRELSEAVKREEFELAAQIRDKIRNCSQAGSCPQ